MGGGGDEAFWMDINTIIQWIIVNLSDISNWSAIYATISFINLVPYNYKN